MICKSCGVEIGGARFCGNCGQDQQTETMKTRYVPDYERKTVECYPSTYRENKTIAFYGRLGWTVISTQRNQEFTGQSSDGTAHYSSCTRILFERDRNIENYAEIKRLSDIAEQDWDSEPRTRKLKTFIFGTVAGALLLTIALCALIFFRGSSLASGALPAGAIGLALLIFSASFLAFHSRRNRRNTAVVESAKRVSLEAADACEKLIQKAKAKRA